MVEDFEKALSLCVRGHKNVVALVRPLLGAFGR